MGHWSAASFRSRRREVTTIMVAAAAALSAPAAAQDGVPDDDGGYDLFHPTPRELMRPLSADRPDRTESPQTVDAGHVQIELSFFEITDDLGGTANDRFSWFPFNLKAGVTPDIDVQLLFEPYVDEEVTGGGAINGIGDTQLRVKVNLWGNDEDEETGFAIMPFIHLPTSSDAAADDHVEGGVILPWSKALTDEWTLGLMLEAGLVHDDGTSDYVGEFVHTAALGGELYGPLGGYAEYIGIVNTEGDYDALLGFGATYTISEDLVLDSGVNLGLTGNADVVMIFAGMTVRF